MCLFMSCCSCHKFAVACALFVLCGMCVPWYCVGELGIHVGRQSVFNVIFSSRIQFLFYC